MGLFNRKSNHSLEIRADFNLPDKVFIDKQSAPEGYEYSFEEPSKIIANILDGYYSNQNYITLFYSVPEIFAPVNEIAKRVSDCTWQLCKDWNDEVDYKDADFNRLFTKPNPLMTMKDLIYQAVCFEILTGRQFFYKNRPTVLPDTVENVNGLFNLQEPLVKVNGVRNVDFYSSTDIRDLVIDYRIGTRVFDSSNVMPIFNLRLDGKEMDLNNCVGQLKGADPAIKNLIPVYQARGHIYLKRGQLGMWVSRKQDHGGTATMTASEKKAVRKEMNQDFGLSGNRDAIGVSEVPLEFVKSSMSIAEMQPFDETLSDALAIYKVLRVPQHLVPRKDQSTFNNTEKEMIAFYTDVIIPFAKRYADIFTNGLKYSEKRRYIRANYDHISVLQADRKLESEVSRTYGDVFEKRFKNGICSVNEWIVSTGGTKISNPTYDKKIFEMTPEELELIRTTLNFQANATQTSSETSGAQA